MAPRYGISAETVLKWRKRGAADCLGRSARPHQLPWKAIEEERAIVCALRRTTNFPRDDLTFIVCHFLPYHNRDSVWRILKAEGMDQLLKSNTSKTRTHSLFRQGCMLYELTPNMPEHRLTPPMEKITEAVSNAGLFSPEFTKAK